MDYHRKFGLTIKRRDTTTVYLKDIQKIVKALFKFESKESDENNRTDMQVYTAQIQQSVDEIC